ncbi:MAG: hypothetical protein N2376_10050 [Clostridia bacterium]|nr:hypothetical protein [Clostridia bacterium]
MIKALPMPYVPQGAVTTALLAENSPAAIRNILLNRNIEIIEINTHQKLPSPLSKHADMQLVNVSEGVLVYAPGVGKGVLHTLKSLGFTLIEGQKHVGPSYPDDVAYNCAIVGRRAFLKAKAADPVLLDSLKSMRLDILDVSQGYAKCSLCIVSQEAVITADKGIHQKARETGLDSLLIPPQKSIGLPGYDYGFIGGTTGLLSADELGFFGNFKTLESADVISCFLKKHGVKPVSLSLENLVDLGGLIPLCSV